MQEVTLYIDSPGGQRTVSLPPDEITIGRTNLAQIVLDDPSLSRLHATIFREGDDVWILDENSSNGTFVNGEKVAPERRLRDGDEILLGSDTRIYVEIISAVANESSKAQSAAAANQKSGATPQQQPSPTKANIPPAAPPLAAGGNSQPKEIPLIPLIGGASAFLIIVFIAVAFFLLRSGDTGNGGDISQGNRSTTPAAKVNTGLIIPVRVLDPLGGEDPDDIEDYLASWEGEEEPLKAEDIEEIKVAPDTISPGGTKARVDLNVSTKFWEQQMAKALSRPKTGGGGLISTPQMYGKGGFAKQLAKGAQLRDNGYKVPLDFADLAELRLKGVLMELPIATESYVLDVGGSATGAEFTQFDFTSGSTPIVPGSEKYNYLKQLADNFEGRKYDLNNPTDRKQMRMRLLRMFNAKSRDLLMQICNAYYAKFKVPLRITSLMRSMDYQKALNSVNGNSYNVRPGTVPPHTTGNTFDVGRNHLPVDAQNFLIETLSALESSGRLDTLIEGNVNACFHTFIYPDGAEAAPAAPVASQSKPPPTKQPAGGASSKPKTAK